MKIIMHIGDNNPNKNSVNAFLIIRYNNDKPSKQIQKKRIVEERKGFS